VPTTSKKSQFANCVKQAVSATLPQTAAEFGNNLKNSFKFGVPLGLGAGGAILISEPEFLPAAPVVLAVTCASPKRCTLITRIAFYLT
jgi:hypothetical protein